ncbi:type 2 lanthipeptide synthetase LanM [Enterococcus faecalis]|uniref:type 2 lanthipeptide synthetase LanM n=1 Tax=Enterococcus faecalis TaxID=1351 RepID=UPI003984AA5A
MKSKLNIRKKADMLYLEKIVKNSLTIDEKIKQDVNISSINYENWEFWERQKGLVTKDILRLKLDYLNYTKDEFTYGLTDVVDKDKLGEFMNLPWVEFFSTVMSTFDINYKKIKVENKIAIACLPFVQYAEKYVENLIHGSNGIRFSKETFDTIIVALNAQLIPIISKVMVIEINEYKMKNEFSSSNSQEQLDEFLNTFFCTRNSYFTFYQKYSVCVRLLAVRTKYFLDNLDLFVSSLLTEKDRIKEFLSIEELIVKDIVFSAGDSHEKGKSVFIVDISNKKIVYKPKNLQICENLEKLFIWINENSGLLNLVFPRGIYSKNYTFQEFVEYKECGSERDFLDFYERFGYLVAICYLLAGSDFHYENVIASGKHPVIIDSETFFQSLPKQSEKDSIEELLQYEISFESILSSALIHQKGLEGPKNSLDVSAFSGTKQRFHKKILQPKNFNSINFKFEYNFFDVKPAKNLPFFGKNISNPENYKLQVILGFRNMMNFFLNYRKEILEKLNMFKDNKIRCVLKDTQTYVELLEYSSHPKYCSTMKGREKLFENMWAYPHEDKRVIESEVNDLMFNDIPVFYSYVDSKDIIDSNGKKIPNHFSNSGYELACKRISNLNKVSIEEQISILLINFQLINSKIDFNQLICNPESLVLDIEKILDSNKKVYPRDTKLNCNWKTVQVDSAGNFFLSPLGEDLYGGLSGVGLYYLKLYQKYNKYEYYKKYKQCINNAKKISLYHKEYETAYKGALAPIYPLLLETYILNSDENLKYIKETFIRLEERGISKDIKIDWLDGLSSVLKLSIECYKVSQDSFYIPIIKNIYRVVIQKIICTNIQDIGSGYAHGISGITTALVEYYNLFPDDYTFEIILELLESEFNVISKSSSLNWCTGLLGMLQSRMYINNKLNSMVIRNQIDEIARKLSVTTFINDDDCLCHGSAGLVYMSKQLLSLKNKNIEKKINASLSKIAYSRLINQKYDIVNVTSFSSVGLFLGYTGIGLALLNLNSKSNDSVLLLSVM